VNGFAGGFPVLDSNHLFNNIFALSGESSIQWRSQVNQNEHPDYPNNCFHNSPIDGFTSANSVNTDPDFYSEERLYFDSPCINAGCDGSAYFDDLQVTDSTEYGASLILNDPDIGCTGGGKYQGILDHSHLNYLNNVTLSSNYTLRGDEYEFASSGSYALTVNASRLLTIEFGTLILVHAGKSIRINGGISADGFDDNALTQNIIFSKFPDEANWGELYLYNINVASMLKGCDISYGNYNVRVYDPSVPAAASVSIEKCQSSSGTFSNLYVSGPGRVDVSDTRIIDGENAGVYVYNNTPNPASTFTSVKVVGNGTETNDAGFYASGTNAQLFGCSIYNNQDFGLRSIGAGITDLDYGVLGAGTGIPNLIFNNGLSYDQNHNFRGAEIRIESNSTPHIGPMNLWDIMDGEREGKFISKATSAPTALTLNHSYLGDNWANDPWDPDMRDDHFFCDAGDAITVSDVQEEYLQGGPDEPNPDGADNYAMARQYQASGDYSQALELYWHDLESEGFSALKQGELIDVQACYIGMNAGWSDFKNRCLQVAEANAEANPRFAWTAKERACYATYYGEGPQAAIEELRELLDEAPLPSDSLFVEMEILWFSEALEGNLDAVENHQIRIEQMSDLLTTIDEGRRDRFDPAIPKEFTISPPYPNPFNGITTLSYGLPQEVSVRLSVFDLSGREVAMLVEGKRPAGTYQAVWNSENLASGLYFVRLQAGEFNKTWKASLLR